MEAKELLVPLVNVVIVMDRGHRFIFVFVKEVLDVSLNQGVGID